MQSYAKPVEGGRAESAWPNSPIPFCGRKPGGCFLSNFLGTGGKCGKSSIVHFRLGSLEVKGPSIAILEKQYLTKTEHGSNGPMPEFPLLGPGVPFV